MTLQICLALLFNAALVLTCAYAFLRGGRTERFGAAVNLLASHATTALRLIDPAYFAPGATAVLLIDCAVAVGFFWLSVTTVRFWPIWASGFAVANLFMTGFGALFPRVPLFAFHTGLGIYAYLALGALALGTYRLPANAERSIRNGSRRSWNNHPEERS